MIIERKSTIGDIVETISIEIDLKNEIIENERLFTLLSALGMDKYSTLPIVSCEGKKDIKSKQNDKNKTN